MDFYLIACLDHDIAYRTHADVWGNPLTRRLGDARFRWAVQHESWLGRFNPVAAWRWLGLRALGGWAWNRATVPA